MPIMHSALYTKQYTKHSLLTISTAIALSITISSSANAKPTGYNQITFQSEVAQTVENDQVQASLYKKAQANNIQSLATTLNNSINQAINIAKRYPTVTISTGQQNTYPRYDKNDNNKIIGWTGQVSVNLKSTDLTATSQLIADLQQVLVMDNLSFGVSETKQKELEQQLMIKASKTFRQRAQSLSQAWGANSYRVINVSLSSGNQYPCLTSRSFMQSAPMVTNAIPSQNFESGNSTITVTANGTIELQP